MRKINFKHSLWTVMAAVLFVSTLVSCDPYSKKRACKNFSIEVSHPFPNTNWAFEEEVLDFKFNIEDTATYFDVALSLLYDTAVVVLKDIPLTLTLTAPDGMQSIVSSHFLLDNEGNPNRKITTGNNAEANVVVFPHRKFKVPGSYTLTVFRRAEKADNYGFLSLTTKVTVSKEQK